MSRVGGIIEVKVGGVLRAAKGEFTYNAGYPKRDEVIGSDGVHGFTEEPQAAFIEGEFTDSPDLSLKDLVTLNGESVTISLANGKVFMLPDAWYAGEGTVGTKEGNIGVRFVSRQRGIEVA